MAWKSNSALWHVSCRSAAVPQSPLRSHLSISLPENQIDGIAGQVDRNNADAQHPSPTPPAKPSNTRHAASTTRQHQERGGHHSARASELSMCAMGSAPSHDRGNVPGCSQRNCRVRRHRRAEEEETAQGSKSSGTCSVVEIRHSALLNGLSSSPKIRRTSESSANSVASSIAYAQDPHSNAVAPVRRKTARG